MGRRKNKAKISKSNKSCQDDIPVETGAAEIDESKSVMVDASENNILSQSECEGQTVEETEKERNVAQVGCSQVDKNTVDTAEDEQIHRRHAAEELDTGLGEGEEVDMGLGEAKGEERLDDNGDEVSDNDDDSNDFDETEEELDDYDDNEDNVEFDEDDFEDDDNEDDDDDDEEEDDDDVDDNEEEEEEEENDFLMEEEEEDEEIDKIAKLENNDDTSKEGDENQRNGAIQGENAKEENEERGGGNLEITKLENNDDTLKEGDENQRNRATQGENAKGENEERGGGSLKKGEKSLMIVKERKKITAEVSDKVASRHNKRQENDNRDDAMKETDKGNAIEDIQDKEGTSKQKVKKLRKSRRKVTAGGSEHVPSKRDDKVELSLRKKVRSMGMIFMCSSKTKKDCYHYKVLGLPANKKDLVGQIYKGMRLFLYDVDLKLLYGIYKAAGRGGYNIQPKAFNSQFPSQVRFTVLEDCLPLAEEKFKKVIRDNYFTKRKFDCQLTYQQVRDLCKLFVSASKGSKAMRSATRVRTRASTDKDRSRVRCEERRSAVAEKRRYHEDSRSHEREVVASAVKRRYHEDSRNHEREGVASAVKRRYREDSRTHEREVVASAVKRRYHEDSRNHEREVVTSAVASVPIRLVPAAVATPSYVYDRTSELDGYRHDWLLERRDSRVHLVPEPRLEHPIIYRREPALNQLDPYRRDVATEHLDLRLRDEIGRHDPYISYRERLEQHRDLPSRDDFVRRRDPYVSSSYRVSTADDHNLRVQDALRRRDPYSPVERPAYRDRVYGTHQLQETDHYLPANRSDYSSAVAPLPEYRSIRSLYRY